MKKTKKRSKRMIKLLTTILTLLLLIGSMPLTLQAMAIETMVNIEEVKEYREEYSKHFKMPDGTFKAVSYNAPVHRMDENGEWQDLENILSENTVKNKQAYVTSDGRTVFSKNISADDNTVFELNDGGYSMKVSFENEGIKNSNAKLSNHAKKYVPTNTDDIETQYEKLKEIDTNTTVKYKNIIKNIDLEYILSANDIKENIIIRKACDDYEFSFIYELVGLSAILCEDGSISLYDSLTNEVKYSIPAPYMYDDNGVESTDVAYSLDDLGNGKYRLTVTPDETWINAEDRAFPVTVDPTIYFQPAYADTYIDSNNPNTSYGYATDLYLSSSSYVFMKHSLASIPTNSNIISSELYLWYYSSSTSGSMIVELYPAAVSWNEYTHTYNIASSYTNLGMSTTRAGVITAPTSANITSTSLGKLTVDITELMRDWYSGTTCYGIVLKRLRGNPPSIYVKSYESGSSTYARYDIAYSTVDSLIEEGTYYIKNAETQKYVHIEGNSTVSGAYIEQRTLIDLSKGGWIVEHVTGSGGYSRIKSAYSNLYLGLSPNDTTVIGQYSAADVPTEDYILWRIDDTTFDTVTISCKATELGRTVLGMSTSSSNDGINLTQIEHTNDIVYNDEWEMAKVLPLSGYELNYDTSLWDADIENHCNCYAYAINNQLDNFGYLWRKQQPGEYSGTSIDNSYLCYPYNSLKNSVTEDFMLFGINNNRNMIFTPVDRYDVCPVGTYKVALVVDEDSDYHWYRQDSNGLWSHKRGLLEVTRYDASSNLIVDPYVADRFYHTREDTLDYSEFVGYFAVTPWNVYYTGT